MRILHVLNSLGGGASIGAYELVRASRQIGKGYRHFAVAPGLGNKMPENICDLFDDCHFVPMRWWNSKDWIPPLRRLLMWGRDMQATQFGWRTCNVLKKLIIKWKIDLVHTNSACTIDGARVACLLRIPHVWHIRERIGRNGFMHFPLSDERLADRIGHLSNGIVPMSRFVGEIFDRHGWSKKTHIVYDCVNVAEYDKPAAKESGHRLRIEWGLPGDSVLIAKVAAVTSMVKRHDIFIRAAGLLRRKFPHVWYAIIGPLPRNTSWLRNAAYKYYVNLQTLAKDAGVNDRLVWAGNVLDSRAIMNSFDILAHACDLEGFGRVAIEAMAARRPVVGPAVGGISESVTDGETGFLVAPGNAAVLADRLACLIENADLRQRQGEKGRQEAVERFSPELHIQQMYDVYANSCAAAS